jgi:hypothetical protein
MQDKLYPTFVSQEEGMDTPEQEEGTETPEEGGETPSETPEMPSEDTGSEEASSDEEM